MSTLKKNSYRITGGASKKRKVLSILEELVGVKLHLNQLGKDASIASQKRVDDIKDKSAKEREAWNKGREERDKIKKNTTDTVVDNKTGTDKDGASTPRQFTGKYKFDFTGVDESIKPKIQNIINQINEILRAKELGLFDGDGDPDTVKLLYSTETNTGTTIDKIEEISISQPALDFRLQSGS